MEDRLILTSRAMLNIAIDNDSLWTFPHCPTASNWQLNWTAILAQFPCLQALATGDRDDKNTWIHTQLVCAALVSLPAWRSLPPTDRSILFAAVLLADIAKPMATQSAEDDRIATKGYVNMAARMVRRILQDLHTPFTIRESIVAIVRFGSLPLWFWDKSQPLRAIIKASLSVRCDWLALVAQAKILGRDDRDRERFLETIELFREFCQEHNCLDRSYQFASNLSRFIYFQKEDADPTYEAYDDTRLEVILMCGLPGTGKDYWIEHHHPELTMVSLDRLRIQMGISPTDDQAKIVQAGRDLAKGYLQTATPFVWNATNIVKPIRAGLIGLFTSYRARIRIVYLEVPIERVLHQNRHRQAQVPESVIHRYRDRLEIPDLTESHQLDYFVSENLT